MNIQALRGWQGIGCALVLATLLFSPVRTYASEEPRITSVKLRDTNVLVTVEVPAGLRKLTLESRARLTSGAWQPRAVLRLDGSGGSTTLQLARSQEVEVLRVRADASEPLPASFYDGTNQFGAQPANSSTRGLENGPGSDLAGGGTSPVARAVEESDLWKRRDDTVYVFNQYRGLRVIDVANPDQAQIIGTLDLPAAGDQMYLLGERHAILLARERCQWDASAPESEVILVDTSANPPAVTAQLPIQGRIAESRLVGTALYVASETYHSQPDGSWNWGVVVTPIDLADPATPVVRSPLWFPGYGQAVAATPEFLFIATPDTGTTGTSTLHCLDITAPDGTTGLYASLPVFGRVPDKFKIDWTDGILRVVSERQVSAAGTWSLSTRLETFRLPDPRTLGPGQPGKLGEIELVKGERLFAARFDGPRAYVVTYRVIDPLWVVDLSDPVQPRISGELHVPGWSTYIQPFGNRLISVGIDDTDGRRVAVSMFDVTNPASPGLLKRVSLGEGWSWSEANYEEKAVTILPDIGLLLIPYVGYGSDSASLGAAASRVQLIDFNLEAGTLGLRGQIPHRFDAQRTALHRERILSLSASDLLTVDASDRDQPVIRHTLPLAWSVDQVLPYGTWLLELTTGDAWSTASTPALRVAPATEPNADRLLVPLPGHWPVLAATLREDRLYVVQGASDNLAPADPTNSVTAATNLAVRIYDLTQLPDALPLVSERQFAVAALGWWPQLKPLWVRPDLLVLAGGGSSYWWGPWWGGPVMDDIAFRYYPGSQDPGASRLITLDVGTATDPRLASDLDLSAADRVQFSPAFTAGGLVYLSHATLEAAGPMENPVPGGAPLLPPEWFRVWRHQLTVVDLADATTPTVRTPIDLPGSLQALGANGNLLYTIGSHWIPNGKWDYASGEWLDASAYDGVAAHLVASLELPTTWPHAVRIGNDVAWLGRAPATTNSAPALESWTLTTEGKFTLLSSLRLPEPPNDLRLFDSLLAAQSGYVIRLFQVADPTQPTLATSYQPEGCLWLTLSAAAGNPAAGLWIPAGMYGVVAIPLP